MTKNIGPRDRIVRFTIGILLIVASLLFKHPVLALLGLFTLSEAIFSWCVLYQILGRNTCPLDIPHPKQKVSLLKCYLTGMVILLAAIILNILAQYLGWLTWHSILSSPPSFSRISLSNWLFLLLIYPLFLASAAIAVFDASSLSNKQNTQPPIKTPLE